MLLRILQLLPMIYRRFQEESQTAIRENKEEMYGQLGMGRPRTASIRRMKDKTYHKTSSGLIRPPARTKVETDVSKYLCPDIHSEQY